MQLGKYFQIGPTSAKNVIATLVIGETFEAIGNITLPLIKMYAAKTNSDFVVLNESELSKKHPSHYEKYQMYELFDVYENVLFIDIDILITPWAGNVFEMVPTDHFSAVSVDSVFPAAGIEKENLNRILGKIDWSIPYFNSGVFLIPKKYRDLLNSSDGQVEKWVSGKAEENIKGLNDQSIINYRANQKGVDFHPLNVNYNFTRVMHTFHTRFNKCFMHYAGLPGNRLALIERDAKIIANPISREIYRRAPAYVWLADRIFNRFGIL